MTRFPVDEPGSAAGATRGPSDPETDEVLDALSDAARVSFGAESVSVAVVDESVGALHYRSAAGRGADAVVGMELPLGRGLAGYAAASGEALAIDDVSRDSRFARDVAERIGYVPRSVLVAPLRRGDDVIGVLSVLDRTQPPGAAALDLAGRFARACAAALDLVAARPAADRDADPDARLARALAETRRLGAVERDAAARLLDDFLAYAASRPR